MSVETGEAGSHYTTKVQEPFFIDLVSSEEFNVVTKVPQEPAELPQGALGAVEAPGEANCFMGDGLQDAEAQDKEGLLGMPAIGCPFDPNQEESVEVAD
jgi:hypothetical protein